MKKWRKAHPDYLPHYRAKHPEAVKRNRNASNGGTKSAASGGLKRTT